MILFSNYFYKSNKIKSYAINIYVFVKRNCCFYIYDIIVNDNIFCYDPLYFDISSSIFLRYLYSLRYKRYLDNAT
jgi:hypothetical protein